MKRHNHILKSVLIALSAFFILSVKPSLAQKDQASTKAELEYAIGADFSFLKAAEDDGTVFRDNKVAKPGLEIFRDHGYNWIRLRLFHSPDRLPNDLDYTIALAKQAKKMGYKFLLDYHYADSWADPGKQPIPEAWQGLNPEVLADSVYAYTRNTIEAFREAGVMPEMVQIGNEIRNGMLWPLGKLPDNWDNLASFIKAGINGVDAGRGQAHQPLIMIHYDQGADPEGARQFYKKINSYDITYDVIGLSYYPWWHGNLLKFRENLLSLVNNFSKDIVLVETAYNWRPTEYQDTLAPYPETPQGQREFLESVHETMLNISSPKIKGIFWWEPAVTGGLRSRGFFDNHGRSLPVMQVFDKYTRGKTEAAD